MRPSKLEKMASSQEVTRRKEDAEAVGEEAAATEEVPAKDILKKESWLP